MIPAMRLKRFSNFTRMNQEVQSIIRNLQNTLSGEPWFGRAIYRVMEEVDPSKAFTKPQDSGHSMIELLYHMITWSGFCLKHLNKATAEEIQAEEELDWRETDPSYHSWPAGLEEFKRIHESIIAILETKNDTFLSEMVAERNFNYRFMLNGLIQHNIYHLGQIAYVKKLPG